MENAPKGNRTPVSALRGPRPRPLDDGGKCSTNCSMVRFLCQLNEVCYKIHPFFNLKGLLIECLLTLAFGYVIIIMKLF